MKTRGFTLLEVMVAVAILRLSLTVILSAQTGLYSAGTHAQNEAVAIGLARCKMGELEENLLRMGYPELDSLDEGPCCKDTTADNMRCFWKVLRVELPQPASFGDVNPSGSAGLNLSSIPGTLGSGMTGGGMMPGATGATPGLPAGAGAIGALISAATTDGGLRPSGDGGMQGLSQMMGNATAATGGVSGLAPMAMSIVYPSLKPMLEASIRKIELTVEWKEGLTKRELAVVQYVTNPMKGGLMGILPPGASADPSIPGFGGSKTGSGPGLTGAPGGPGQLPGLGGLLR